MATLQVQNQFNQKPVQGQLDLLLNTETVSAEVDVTSAGSLVAGQAVKIVDSLGGVPKVVECAADSDDVFGFINYSIKDRLFNAYSKVELSIFRGNVMYMTASAAIARNAKVMVVIASKKVATRAGGGVCIGRAYDKASADGDLIRVLIDLPGVAS